jgi:tripartite-type tricarboxylate transporter receptor subunit TctC
MKRRTLIVSAAATLAAPSIVRAQAWPAHPIRVIHGYDAGSNPDTIARHLSVPLTDILGVQIVVEPKPGAAERLAATQIARMKPDGGVLYLMTGGQAVVSATDRTLSYDVLRDFDFVAIVTRFPFVFTVAPDSRFKAIVGGRLDMQVITFSNAQPMLKTDKLRALAVTSKERHPGFPDVPTVAETLVPDYDVVSWLGFTTPAGLPPALRDRLNDALRQAMARPEIKGKLEELGNDTRVSTPSEFRARVEQDLSRWRPLAHVVNQS